MIKIPREVTCGELSGAKLHCLNDFDIQSAVANITIKSQKVADETAARKHESWMRFKQTIRWKVCKLWKTGVVLDDAVRLIARR